MIETKYVEQDEKQLVEFLRSLNDSLEEIHNTPVEVPKRLPSTFEIMVDGVKDANGIDFLFSPKIDEAIGLMFSAIESGRYQDILANKENLENVLDKAFGKGSFQGPVSTTVLNSIQSSIQSRKYNEMKSHLGKTMLSIKKISYVLKNLEKEKKNFDKNSEEYQKYVMAVYAIKQVIKFTARVYRNRKIINKKVFEGLHNLVHENLEVSEPLL